MIPFQPSPPPIHIFPAHLLALAEKLSRAPWPDADREMRVMQAESRQKYLAELLAKILRATGAAEEGIDGVTVDQLSERYRRQSTELFWDEMLIALNDATLARVSGRLA